MAERHYPVGIQTFSEIIRGGYVYIDKTDLVWQMQHKRKYIFLSRPRRFGKSLLSSTLHSFFAGQKDLFEGLKIMKLEKEWNQYPIIHLDISTAKGQDSKEDLRQTLMWILQPYAKQYGKDESETSPGKLLTGIIKRVHHSTGKQVVIIIDEYDAPMLEIVHDNEMLDELRKVMQEFYMPLKAFSSQA